jgi:hypothetical protein
MLYLVTQPGHGRAKTLYIGLVLVKQVQHQAKGGFLTYPRQFRKLGNCILQ